MKKITTRPFFDAYTVHCNAARLLGVKHYNIIKFWYRWRFKWRKNSPL